MNKKILLFLPAYICFITILVNNLALAQSTGNDKVKEQSTLSDFRRSDSSFDDYLGLKSMNPLDKKISLSVKDQKIERVLEIITGLSGVKFVYDSKIINNKTISLEVKDQTVAEILTSILDSDIGFMPIGQEQIVLAKNNSLNSRTGGIKGLVADENGEPLMMANVILLENNYGGTTNYEGEFIIRNLNPGEYTIKVSFIGYASYIEKIRVEAGRLTSVNVVLKSESFSIGSIEVVADNQYIPTEPETKTKITSGEIEHLQATSLNDVLSLTPGTKTTNPTLNTTAHAKVREGDDIGTQVVMDNVPISNNANMQVGAGYSTVNSGIDLRSIPAENIESVEVVRGVPSVKYGDLTDGLMIVKTRTSASSPLLKIKYNPNLYETNGSGGFEYNNWIFNGNLNIATSQRDVRVEGDGYTRVAGQVNIVKETDQNKFKNSFYVTKTFDERKEEPGAESRDAWYNRDLTLKYNGSFERKFSSFESLEATFSLSFINRNSYKQKIVSRDNLVLANSMTEAHEEGTIVFGSYLGKQWINGEEWNFYGDLNYTTRFYTGEYLHSTLAGITYRDEFNTGEGITFDPMYPLVGTTTAPRLRSYDELPYYDNLSLYIEDKIVGNLWNPFSLRIGFRYEIYKPLGINLKGLLGKEDLIESQNGSFLNPRINFSYNLFETTQIRLGYGVTSKSPPMGMLYDQTTYFDIVDTVDVADASDASKNFSIISTYLREGAVPNLKGYKQYKYEVSIDQEFDFGGLSATAFRNITKDGFSSTNVPSVFYKYSYPNWPDVSTTVAKDTLINKYSTFGNYLDTKTEGFEITFRTKRIPSINTIFKFDAAYYYTERSYKDIYKLGTNINITDLGGYVVPLYNTTESYTKKLLFNYRLEIQAKSLGMWMTIHIQQQLMNVNGERNLDDIYPVAYYSQDDQMIIIPENERHDEKYKQLRKSYEQYELLEEDKKIPWLVNIVVSKSLWKGSAVSFFVNNFLNQQVIYKTRRTSPSNPTYGDLTEEYNSTIFYGLELHTTF